MRKLHLNHCFYPVDTAVSVSSGYVISFLLALNWVDQTAGVRAGNCQAKLPKWTGNCQTHRELNAWFYTTKCHNKDSRCEIELRTMVDDQGKRAIYFFSRDKCFHAFAFVVKCFFFLSCQAYCTTQLGTKVQQYLWTAPQPHKLASQLGISSFKLAHFIPYNRKKAEWNLRFGYNLSPSAE